MPETAAHSLHLHPLSFISSTYYVVTPRGCPGLKFEDPRLSKFMAAPPKLPTARPASRPHITYPAEAGNVILFESWLHHENAETLPAAARPSVTMTSMLPSHPASGRALAAALLLASLAACESDRGARYGRTTPDAKTTPSAPTPELEAHGEFFAGQIETEVLLGRAGFGPRIATDGRASGNGERQRRGGGGFSGGGRRGGGMGSGMGGGRGGETAGARGGGRQNNDGEPVPQIRASNAAPVQLHLRLTNHGTEPIEIEVTDFNSDLGNFVVQPRKLSIPAGGSVEAEPMTSRLGVNATEIPLTVVIRANGRSEKQDLFLRVKAPSPPAATSAPTPPTAPP